TLLLRALYVHSTHCASLKACHRMVSFFPLESSHGPTPLPDASGPESGRTALSDSTRNHHQERPQGSWPDLHSVHQSHHGHDLREIIHSHASLLRDRHGAVRWPCAVSVPPRYSTRPGRTHFRYRASIIGNGRYRHDPHLLPYGAGRICCCQLRACHQCPDG